jgi:hypothetical protein
LLQIKLILLQKLLHQRYGQLDGVEITYIRFRSLNIGDEVFDCGYKNFGINFERYVRKTLVELYQFVYKSSDAKDDLDVECSFNTPDNEDLV